MARNTALAAGVLSLILVGTWGKALAGTEPVRNDDSSPGLITLLGLSPHAKCAVKFPAVKFPAVKFPAVKFPAVKQKGSRLRARL